MRPKASAEETNIGMNGMRSMLELEHGIVKRFDDRLGNRFGYLYVLDQDGQQTGEELWFHANDGQWVETVEGDILFVGPIYLTIRIHDPKVGDKLAFRRVRGKNHRDKAAPWTHAEGYDNRVEALTAPRYQLIQRMTENDEVIDELLLWEGQGSAKLSEIYPIRVIAEELRDPLATRTGEGGITTSYIFKVWQEPEPCEGPDDSSAAVPGHWAQCGDPRYRSAAVRELDALREEALGGVITMPPRS